MAINNSINGAYRVFDYTNVLATWGPFSFPSTTTKLTSIGRIVTLQFPAFASQTTTQNANLNITLDGAGVPSGLRPAVQTIDHGFVNLSGTVITAQFIVNTDGTINIKNSTGINLNGTSLQIFSKTVTWNA